MPPGGKEHEDAIHIIMRDLRREFKRDLSFQTSRITKGAVPDLWFHHPVLKGIIVVEVGNTNAEKIFRYQNMKGILEIRWYTKLHDGEIKLVGKWEGASLTSGKISRDRCSYYLTEKEMRDTDRENKALLWKRKISMETHTCCMGCGEAMKIEQMFPFRYKSHDYLVCYDCKEKGDFFTVAKIRDAMDIYNQWRKAGNC
jgi:hypothetical protein